MAYLAACDNEIVESVETLLSMSAAAPGSEKIGVAQAVGALMWPRGMEIRQRSLQSYSPFRRRRITDPALVRFLFEEDIPEVCALDEDWRQQLGSALADYGSARVWIDSSNNSALRSALVVILGLPVEVGYMRFFATVESVERAAGRLIATVNLRELV
jgi:hypothetical protein